MTGPLHLISIKTRTAKSAVRFILFEAHINVDKPSLRLSPAQVNVLLAAHPTLADHACRSRGLGRFGDKLPEASLPHVVEHLAIDRLVAGHDKPVSGHTVKRYQEDAAYLVRLQVPEGLGAAAEQALRDAIAELNALMGLQ